MGGQFLADSSLAGVQRTAAGDRLALESYLPIREYLVAEFDQTVADLFAEPDSVDQVDFAWYTPHAGEIRPAAELSRADYTELSEKAVSYFEKIRKKADNLIREGSKAERDLGALLLSAATVPDDRWRESLFSVDGKPVFVNWGAAAEGQEGSGGPIEIERKERLHPVTAFPWFNLIPLLWLVFLVLNAVIFARLIDGCALFTHLGGVPYFCDANLEDDGIALAALLDERQELEKAVYALSSQLASAPLCSTGAPAFSGRPNQTLLEPPDKSGDQGSTVPPTDVPEALPPLPSELIDGKLDGSVAGANYNQSINASIRAAGGGQCNGLELIALWTASADIDLVVYCPVDGLPSDQIPDDRVIGPHNLAACGGTYDLESDGLSGPGPHLERVCLGSSAEVGEYLAGVAHDNSNGTAAPVSVRLISRGAGVVDEISVNSRPGQEADDFLPFTIEP